jgi:putative tryptophan/tyrosine transport system substrate-binding protein
MNRRDLVTLLGSAAATWPLAAGAQQAPMPVAGFLHPASPAEPYTAIRARFLEGLQETGYVPGQNVMIEYRWAEGRYDRLPQLAADLVRRQVAVLLVGGGPAAILAARSATSTIPIVFVTGDDPLRHGVVSNLSRPGGNVTGVSFFTTAVVSKRVELLRDLLPNASSIAYLVNPANPESEPETKDVSAAARSLGFELHVLNASSEREIDAAFATLIQLRAGALLTGSDPLLFSRGNQIAALSIRHAVPAIFVSRENAVAGGLASYGTRIPDAYRQAGVYVGRILKGAKPADLPVVQPTKFELVLNLNTAKVLGIAISPKLLALADEVIE